MARIDRSKANRSAVGKSQRVVWGNSLLENMFWKLVDDFSLGLMHPHEAEKIIAERAAKEADRANEWHAQCAEANRLFELRADEVNAHYRDCQAKKDAAEHRALKIMEMNGGVLPPLDEYWKFEGATWH